MMSAKHSIGSIAAGVLVAVAGLVLSHTYRPYIYSNGIHDFHIADVIGNLVCVPSSVLVFYGWNKRYSVGKYTVLMITAFIAYELLGLFNIHGTFDWYDIAATLVSGGVFYLLYLLYLSSRI